jgi:two-component system, chemotaxis family, CheB/CheR fusion protein
MNDPQSDQPKSTAKEETVEEQLAKNQELFPIVGIGASAGGLAAFTELLRHLPTDTEMGFVLIQHLNPESKSRLSEILARITEMPVIEVNDGMSVEPNHVYIIPPNTKMTITQERLRLSPREKTHGMYMPVDVFFSSLAMDRGNKAIGIILSGMDGDGAQGLKAIKAAGGITFAQCEATAKYTGMPNTAVATGDVDFILPPDAIAEKLANISSHPYVTQTDSVETVEELSQGENALQNIFKLLLAAKGIDFTYYKHTTLKRRILRRMVLYRLEKLENYVTYLQNNPAEVEALFQDFLIHVTSFFRDSNAFEVLKNQVFPSIMQNRSPDEPIRIWVAGCSTGEEVYSIAICLLEFLDDLQSSPKIQIFGTDVSDFAIEKARLATYIPSQVDNISPERLRRFFNKVEGGYQATKLIRQICVFAKQNLLGDPPFSHLDLISCRNVLIYFGSALQKKVIPLFHYSLKPTGFLLLGTSESTGDYSDLFTLIDKKQKIYSRKLTASRLNFDFFTINYLGQKVNDEVRDSDAGEGLDLEKEADRIVWNKYAPPGVIINSALEILQFRGETSPYLAPAPGKPSFSLLKMAQVSLRLSLRMAIDQAKRLDIPIRKEGIQLTTKEQRELNFEVIPFQVPPSQERYFLVLFEDVQASAIPQSADDNLRVKPSRGKQTAIEQELIQLKQELAATKQELTATKEYLQSIIREQEATNQELMTANEEILSSNEELQSTNEELETAKEEIQSTNEELSTTNDELHSRIQESNKANSDINNLLISVNIPIVILAKDLTIRRFTPMAEKILNLIPTDVGRPLSHIKPNINVPNLEQTILEVIDTLVIKEQEVQDTEGHWYDLRIRPYKNLENQIDGAMMVLVDINALKRSSEQLQESRDYAEAIVETIQESLLVLDRDLRVVTANPCFYETFQVSKAETEHHSIFELGNGQWNIPALRSLLEEVLPQNNQIDNFEVDHTFENIGRKTMLLNGCKIAQANNNEMILLTITDITERQLLEEQRNQLLIHEQLARATAEVANRTKDEFLSIVSHELRNPLNSILGWVALLRNRSFDAQKTAQALEIIERSAKSQAKLIEDLLNISSITAGKLQLNLTTIDLLSVIAAAIHVASPSADAKNIQIESVLGSPDTHRVSGDPERLQQVLSNLLSNSIKFTPPGGQVTVKLDRIGSFARVQVIDTGQGISADFLPHVFEHFRQADSSTTRAHGGLGLGLSIVSYLVEAHGGTIQAESPGEGQGTTMTVKLPLQNLHPNTSVSSDLSPVSKAEQEVPLDTMPTLLGLRVLVVDDEAGLLELLKTMLEEYGAQVTAVTSAKEAIAQLRANPLEYDILLSDIGMPHEDGYALIRQVRALNAELGGQIPAIALSAYARQEEQRKSLSAGFQRHIVKPVEPHRLVSMIAELTNVTR